MSRRRRSAMVGMFPPPPLVPAAAAATNNHQVAEENEDEDSNESFNDEVDPGAKRKRSSRLSYSTKSNKKIRPTPVNGAASSSSSWECLICTFVNTGSTSSCQMCGQLKAVIRRDANEWACRQCTMVNPPTNRRCETCDAKRENDGGERVDGAAAAAASSSSSSSSSLVAAAAVPASSSASLIDMTRDLSTSPLPRRRSNRLEDNLTFLSGIEESFGRIDIDSHLLSLIANSIRSRWTLIETKFGGLHHGGSHIFQPSDITALLKTLVREACKKALQHAHTMELIIRMMEIERLEEVDGRCCKCHARGANVPLLYSENCFPAGEWRDRHYICVKDAADYVMGLVDKKECGKVICPFEGCKKEVDMRFLKRCLNQSQFSAYSDACFHIATADSSHYQRCPTCNSLTEIVGLSSEFQLPKGGITLTDDSGKLLSEEAFRHYSEFRLRCHGPGCQTNFCTACRSVPYHMGFTCAQFKEYTESQHCRWCAEQLSESNIDISLANGLLVCKSAPCQQLKSRACQHLLPCRHPCFGVRDETNHPPCLEEGCSGNDAKVDGSGYCGICWVDELRSAPIVQLTSCPHAFHEHCVVEKIGKGKPFTRITFGFLDCPACKKQMSHPSEAIQKVLKPAMEFYDKVVEKAVARLKIENMLKDEKLISPTSRYYGNPQAYALDSFAYYNCFKCAKFYFGGRRDCEQNAQAENRPDEEFVCFDCADLKSVTCKVSSHREFQLWKCRFCCNPAVWFCFGTTHFCDPCHREAHTVMKRPKSSTKQCPGIERCPLKMKHSANGPDKDCEFNIGCGVCTEKLTKKIAVQKSEEKVDEEIKKSKLLKNSSSSSPPSSGNSIFTAAANVFAGLGVSSIFASPAVASNPPAAAAAAAAASPKRTRSNSRRGRG